MVRWVIVYIMSTVAKRSAYQKLSRWLVCVKVVANTEWVII